jgi:hypothetical protein
MKIGLLSLYCCIGLILTSCTLPHALLTPKMADKDKGAGRLLSIRVERWDTLRFSGLLGLREDVGGLHYVLLDATGVKLLEVEVAGDGSHNLLRVSGPLMKTDFAPFLSEALARIYLQLPTGIPCTGSWLYQVCREEMEDKGWNMYGQAGPFKVWLVSARRVNLNSSGVDAESLVYRQPWLGVQIYLEPTKLSP